MDFRRRSWAAGFVALSCARRCFAGARPKTGRHVADAADHQPGQHVDPRGIDDRGARADDGRLQQPGHVRPARAAEQPFVDRPRSGRELDLERGRQVADLQAARRASNGTTASPSPPADVKCTWDMIAGNAPEKFRVNPRKSWYRNLDSVTVDDDYQVTFNLKRPQPSFIALLASGWSPVYPCHVPPAQMRRASDRHRPVQIRRVQAQRVDQDRPQPGLLEEGPALSRRDRIHVSWQTRRPRSWPSRPAISTASRRASCRCR